MKRMSEINAGMRLADNEKAFWGAHGGEDNGMFAFFLTRGEIHVIASSGEGWDHVSVSAQHRIPTWTEMEFIKRLFFKPDETAMQLHVPPKEHINDNAYVLHLWRPHDVAIPRPPAHMV